MNWSFYDNATGEISGRTFSGSVKLLALNTRPGMIAIEGSYDRLSQRVDVATGQVVDFQPPSPGDDYEWHADTRRYRKRIDVALREAKDLAARALLEEIDLQKVRPLAQLALDAQDAAARARLIEIEEQAAEVRKDVAPTDEERALAERLSRG